MPTKGQRNFRLPPLLDDDLLAFQERFGLGPSGKPKVKPSQVVTAALILLFEQDRGRQTDLLRRARSYDLERHIAEAEEDAQAVDEAVALKRKRRPGARGKEAG